MRPRELASRLPRPLLFLLAAVVVLGLAWSLLVPPWQAPDENYHFAYVQGLAEGAGIPGEEEGQITSSEQQRAAEAVNADQLSANVNVRPVWSERLYEDWRASPLAARDDGGGQGVDNKANPARTNPPLYYALQSLPYYATSGGTVIDQLYLMRLFSFAFLLVMVAATWLLIGELFGSRPLLQLAGASIVGLQPMAVFVSASVNPDSLLYAATAIVLWLGVRVLKRGLTPWSGAALCAALAVAILSKATAYAFVPAVLVVLGVGLARLDAGAVKRRAAVAAGVALAAPVLAWVVYARLSDRPAVNQVGDNSGYLGPDLPGPLGYLWQFYLPKLPFGASLPESYPDLPAFDYFLQGGWAKFGWLEIIFPDPVYIVLGLVTAAILAGGLVALLRRGLRGEVPTAVFLGLAAVGLLGGLHATEFRIMADQGVPVMQGRYLLPLLPLLGLSLAGALTLLDRARRPLAVGVLLGGLLALQLFSLGMVAERFYV